MGVVDGKHDRGPSGTVCYVGQCLPSRTTTFIEHEIAELRRLGLDIVICSNRRPDPSSIPDSSKAILDEVVSVFPRHWPSILRSHAAELATHPVRYVRALAMVAGPDGAQRDRGRSLLHFAGAVVLAHRVRGGGITHVRAHFTHNPATFALVMATLLGVPYSLTVHTKYALAPPLLERKVAGASFLAVISEATRRGVLEAVGSPGLAERTTLVRCGVDTDVFSPPPRRSPTTIPHLVAVGQLVEKKGHDVLIESTALLVRRGVDLRLTIVGDGPDRARLESLIARLGLHDVVDLAGAASPTEVLDILHRADIAVLACRPAEDGSIDGVPVALMEAMACGLPVVSTTVSGITELIEDGVDGRLTPPDDPRGLAAALSELLDDSEGRAQLGAAARQTIVEGWRLDEQAHRVASLLAKAHTPPSRPSPPGR